MIEALGAPHTEIALILVNGETQPFSYRVQDGDRINVLSGFESLDVSSLVRVLPRPLRDTRFVLDVQLGRPAAYLRMVGFDAVYRNDFSGDELESLIASEKRILLTRDRQIPKWKAVTHVYCVQEGMPRKQAVEVVRRFDLAALPPLLAAAWLASDCSSGRTLPGIGPRPAGYGELWIHPSHATKASFWVSPVKQ